MLSPALFGCQSYDEMIEKLTTGNVLNSEATGILLSPVAKNLFRISGVPSTFDTTVPELHKVLRSAASEAYSRGEYDGFQVIDENGRAVVPDESKVFDFESSLDLVRCYGGTSYMVPIPKGHAAILKHTAPVFGDIKVLSDVVDGAYDNTRNLDESHKELAQHGLNLVGAIQSLSQALRQERAFNARERQFREEGKESVSLEKSRYDALYERAAVLDALLADERFRDEMRHMLTEIEVSDLDTTVEFDAAKLIPRT